VSYATRRDAEGQKIDNLADDNQSDVEATLKAIQEAKRHAKRPIELKHRDTVSAGSELDATPVPPIAMHAPALPALAPPDTEQNRNAMPSPPADSSRPQPHDPTLDSESEIDTGDRASASQYAPSAVVD
jgi:hypothetical protein